MPGLKYENWILAGTVLAFVSLDSFLLFGLMGLRTVLGFILTFFPFYMIFDNFELSDEEKMFFCFFTGITTFSSLVYWLGFIVPFRMSILAVFAFLLIVSYMLKKLIKKKTTS